MDQRPQSTRQGVRHGDYKYVVILCIIVLVNVVAVFLMKADFPAAVLRSPHAFQSDFPELPHYRRNSIFGSPDPPRKTIVEIQGKNITLKYLGNTNIPLLLHQAWKTSSVPESFLKLSSAWKSMYPAWHYVLWTEDDNRQFLKNHYPWFLRFYDSYPQAAAKADLMRYFYMLYYGGMYVNLDLESLRSLEPVLTKLDDSAVVAYLSDEFSDPQNLPNRFFASVAGHDLWWHCIFAAIDMQHLADKIKVEEATGPGLLRSAVQAYCSTARELGKHNGTCEDTGVQRIDTLRLLAPGAIYPFDFRRPKHYNDACSFKSSKFDPVKCKSFFPNAYTLAYWSLVWD